jgi:1-acyl-sn-glycerol-3-phosphate acyltransferase
VNGRNGETGTTTEDGDPEGHSALRPVDPPSAEASSLLRPERGESKKAVSSTNDSISPETRRSSRADRRAQPVTNGDRTSTRDRSLGFVIWYQFVKYLCATLAEVLMRWRATGQANVPASGGALLVCNHVSFLDVFFLGIPLGRPLNYVARSTLFVPVLGALIRSVGGFPIQREGIGASGMKETLRRLQAGGIVALFPEGTRSHDGELGPLKPGIAALAARVGVPVVPAGLAGMFEIWPRSRRIPVLHPIRIHYGRPIFPDELAGLDTEAITRLIRARMQECHSEASGALRSDMNQGT